MQPLWTPEQHAAEQAQQYERIAAVIDLWSNGEGHKIIGACHEIAAHTIFSTEALAYVLVSVWEYERLTGKPQTSTAVMLEIVRRAAQHAQHADALLVAVVALHAAEGRKAAHGK